MQIAEIQHDLILQPGQLLCAPNMPVTIEERSPGLHVSEIIADVGRIMGYLKRDDQDELDWTLARYRLAFGQDVARMFPSVFYRVVLGLSWEWWLGSRLDINFHGIGELERDGIVGTPDGLSFDGIPTLHEIKLTWKSSRSDREDPFMRISNEFMWLAQTKAYCWQASEAVPVSRAHLHVYWVNGNYKNSGPEYRLYQLDFEERELEANWRLLRTAGARLVRTREN